ncbi:hypothetical protein SAMN06265348_104219 [Pedobacter westerhofensis]|uniref:Uncharacterized protein n=1 Tax=Pedobacter westerhofensis TaxID=425512 RepID=A0A521CWP6_9SPHI|nr:hypothetical protein [Pedobacter westerhofensis]SMO63090.1 hypothetical protein SAMN06265348_104219 [Pedobacter westerhofensis]
MEFYNSNQKEVLKFAEEILKWELPRTLSQADLDHIKLIANSAITHSHDVMNVKLHRIVIKPKISIADLAKFNRRS